ncbi:MAG: AAA family ATPase [Methyloceanibacter sp.]
MKVNPDINDTLREEGEEAVRARHDNAKQYQRNGPDDNAHPDGNGAHDPRIRLVAFDDIKLGTEPRYLVRGLIPLVGLTVIWGPPKCGKSFSAFDLMMHVALGWEYRSRRVQQGTVVYCAFEGQSGIRGRVEAFRQRFLAENAGSVPFYLQAMMLDLVRDHAELVAAIRLTLGEVKPVAVVLDTLNRSLRGSESSDEDMTAYISAADAIREVFDCSVIIVHHCGIDGTRPRGHTSLTGAVDAQLAVKRDGTGNIVVTVEWMKDGPEGDTIASRLEKIEVGTDEDGESITSCVVEPVTGDYGKPQAKITGQANVALDLLRTAVTEAGEILPASNHVPVGVRGVQASLWRRYCYQATVTDSDDPDAKRKAFNRASKKLHEIKAIGVWNDWVWIADHANGTCGTERDVSRSCHADQSGTDRDTPLKGCPDVPMSRL